MKININDKIFNIDVLHINDGDYYQLNAKNYKKEIIGFLNFYMSKSNKRGMTLNKIEIDEKYQGQGYGKALIKAFEYIVCLKRKDYIEGKFYPTNKTAKPFYESHGYSIERCDYDQVVCKTIKDIDKLKDELEPMISDYEVVEVTTSEKDDVGSARTNNMLEEDCTM